MSAVASSNRKRKIAGEEVRAPGVFREGDRVRRTVTSWGLIAGMEGTVCERPFDGAIDPGVDVLWDGKEEVLRSNPDNMELIPKKAKTVVHDKETAIPSLDEQKEATDEIKWLAASQAKYCDFELVQEAPVKLGFRCTKADLARLGSDFLSTLLECADREKLARVTVPNGTFADFETMDALFGVTVRCWHADRSILLTPAQTIGVLHAADALGLYHNSDMAKIKGNLLASVGKPGSPLVELFELGCRYHWKEMQEAAAKKLQALSAGDIPDHVLLKCAPFWRT